MLEFLICLLMVIVLSSLNPLEKLALQSSKVLVNVEIDDLKGLSSFYINPEVMVGELIRTIYRQRKPENSWYSDEDVDLGIYFNDVEMKANETLSHYNIHEGATVHLVSSRRGKRSNCGFFLCVIMPKGPSLTKLDVDRKTTVRELKGMIKKRTKHSTAEQELFVGEKKMKDDKSLSSYGICQEGVIRLEIASTHKACAKKAKNKIRKHIGSSKA